MINGIVKLRVVVYEKYQSANTPKMKITAMFEKDMPAYALFQELLGGSVVLVNSHVPAESAESIDFNKPIATVEVGVMAKHYTDVQNLLSTSDGWETRLPAR